MGNQKQRIPDIVWVLCLMVGITMASGTSQLATPDIELFISKDKLVHFLVFGLLATSIIRMPKVQNMGWKGAVTTVCAVSLFGAADELHQSFTPGRMVEIADWVADTLGALLAVVLYCKWRWYRSLLEKTPQKRPQPKTEPAS